MSKEVSERDPATPLNLPNTQNLTNYQQQMTLCLSVLRCMFVVGPAAVVAAAVAVVVYLANYV